MARKKCYPHGAYFVSKLGYNVKYNVISWIFKNAV